MSKLTEGMKFDGDKPDWSLLNMETVQGLVRVLTMGATKYSRHNWIDVEPYRYYAALLRHITAWSNGESIDNESGLNHLYHAMANLYFLIEHENKGNKYNFGEK